MSEGGGGGGSLVLLLLAGSDKLSIDLAWFRAEIRRPVAV